ncbi:MULTISPECIES: Uma2 family endonuclease [unclassified Microcoleus]|uniref:Uma2 family endonuclease n=1 Tax=unclassified Microcoleus TaxID=2642155 RepID=UPI0025F96795|nr:MULTISPECIES: Uma2 family endonuclease [unclassified Microcoleus]
MVQTLTYSKEELAGSHLVLQDISWEIYEQLLEIFAERSTPRMTYYQGTLELMVPLPEHERYSWTLGRLIVALSEEIGIEIIGLKSSTWRSKPKKAGKEADECFYIQNEALMRGKLTIDLKTDPPPDLAVEMDLTSSSINKMAVYAELKVPEVWIWKKGKLIINILNDTGYVESETSLAFASFPVKEIAQFMHLDSEKGENARIREFREWVRSHLN